MSMADEIQTDAANVALGALHDAGIRLDVSQVESFRTAFAAYDFAQRLANLIPGDSRRVSVPATLQHAVGGKYDLRDGTGVLVVRLEVAIVTPYG